jgi:hypothetical protein
MEMLIVSQFGTDLKQIGSNLDELQGLTSCCGRARAVAGGAARLGGGAARGWPARHLGQVAGRLVAGWRGGMARRGWPPRLIAGQNEAVWPASGWRGQATGGTARRLAWAAVGGGKREGESFLWATHMCYFAVSF